MFFPDWQWCQERREPMSKNIVAANVQGCPVGLTEADIDAFAKSLSAVGYTALTVQQKHQIASAFALWTRKEEIAVVDLQELHATRFIKEGPRRRSKVRDAIKRRTLRLLFSYLRTEGKALPSIKADKPLSPVAMLQERFEQHLRQQRGLSEWSLQAYRPFIYSFLVEQVAKTGYVCPATLDPQSVRDFLLTRIRNRPTRSAKLLGTALRSFLRFLFQSGETAVDLALAVPTVRQWRQAAVHSYLVPKEVEQVLRTCNLTTPVGRRNHAILLLLARLGLRAGEVIALELGDIQWRTGEILIRGKGGVFERLPLLADVGKALAFYIKQDRGPSSSRRVFLRSPAPRVGLTTQTAVGAIARRAIARAGLHPRVRGAHLFRHSLATNMIRHGASMTEIGEVLRHRSPDTTGIYAKVDFGALSTVASQWPMIGGA
jgi:integrase/recombinase XerD